MMKKRTSCLLFYFILAIYIITGCNNIDSNKDNNKNNMLQPNWKLENNQKLVYNPFMQCFIKYDLDKKQNNMPIPYTKSNIVQYSFNTPSKIFTSGHSLENNFTIIENKNGKVKEIYKMKNNNLAVFPLATDGENCFFIETDYSNEINSCIVKYDNNEIYKYTKTNGLVSYGALMNNTLYYTVYEPLEDKYTLYTLDISDYDNNPKIIKKGLIAGEILFLNNQLYYSDKKMFFNEKDTFEKKSVNLSDNKSNKLIQISPSSDSSYLELVVIDKQHNKVIYNNTNVLAIDFSDKTLKAYFSTDIDNIYLYEKTIL